MARRKRHYRTVERTAKQEVKKQKKYTHLWLIAAGIALCAYLEGLITGYLIGKHTC